MHIEEEIKPLVTAFFDRKRKTMGDALGMEFTMLSRKRVEATMPVDENTIQPFGLLHGGASVALGETLCSVGSWLNVGSDGKTAVGLEINANHIRAVRSGKVTGTAEPIHRGRQTQVWQFTLHTEDKKLVCTGRCTLAIVNGEF